ENFLRNKKEITAMVATVGQSSDGGFGGTQSTPYKSEIDVTLIDKNEREDGTYVYAAKIKRELEGVLVGAKISTVPVGFMGGADQAPISLTVTGPDFESVMTFVRKAEAQLRTVPGATGIELSSEEGSPEVAVQVDRDKMAALGLSLQTVGMTMQTAFSGNTDAKFRAGEYEYDINVRF